MTLFFPLNFLLMAYGGFSAGNGLNAEAFREKVVADQDKQGKNEGAGEVKGAETEKDILKSDQQHAIDPIFSSQFIPVRKEGVPDLKIPGAHASVVIDAGSGTVLHYNEGRQQRQIASLTKIMTAILVMEKIKDLDELVTIDEEDVYIEGTKIGCPRSGYCISTRLKVGERISVNNLLTAMLMNSANDAAIALGKHIGGTQEGFAEMMNQKAKQLGLSDTHFCTPSGLEIDGREQECYSSAYDIARIAAYSLRYKLIWDIAKLPTNTVITSSDGKISHTILNTDLALDQVPNIIGAKTGFTPLAGYSLLMAVADASKKHRIVVVLLDDQNRWVDIKKAVSWTFNSYIWK